MKKLIIFAVAIVAAVTTHAAAFSWSGGNIYSSDLKNKYTGSAEMYAYLVTAGVGTSIKVADISISNGVLSASDVQTSITAVDTTDANLNTYNFYFVITDGDYTFTSIEKEGIAQATATTQVKFGNLATATQTASNWTSQNVPEPTSGLLLLCGLAGLALRRKKA